MEWENFTLSEFECKCGCGLNEMTVETINALQRIRDKISFPMIISSGYRCRLHPDEIEKSNYGPHTTGQAVDVLCSGEQALLIMTLAVKEDEWYGFGFNQKGKFRQRFVHLDQCETSEGRPRPHVWSY